MRAYLPESLLLRRVLQANSAFSVISGVTVVAAAALLSRLFGVGHPAILIGVGLLLLAFAVGLFQNSRRESVNETEVVTAIAMDAAWVAGSIILIGLGVLSTAGNWAVAIIADVVLLFAILQAIGLRRLRRVRTATVGS